MESANFKELLKGLLVHNKKAIDCFEDASTIKAKFAFNEGLKSIEQFLELYYEGEVGKEFIDLLIEKSQGK